MDSPLTIVDAIVITFTFLSTILAMARGITREVLGVASLIAASFLSIYLADDASPLLTSIVNLEPIASKFAADANVIASWLTGGLLFVVLWIIFTVITAKLSRYIDNSSISGIDSALGFTFGMLRGFFIIGIIYTMYTHFIPPEKYDLSVKQAKTKVILDYSSDFIIGFSDLVLPTHISEGFIRKPQAEYQNLNSTSSNKNDKQALELKPVVTPEDIIEKVK